MNRFTTTVLISGLLLSATAQGDPITLSLLPPDGIVAGAPGSTVGWGYTITNNTTDWIQTESVSSDPFLNGVPNLIFDFPAVAPGSSVTLDFSLTATAACSAPPCGIYELTWDSSAPLGFTNTGMFTVSSDFFSAQPGTTGATDLGAAPNASATYFAIVSPEPSGWLLICCGLGVLLVLSKLKKKPRLRRSYAAIAFAAALGVWLLAARGVSAQTASVLYNFKGAPDGQSPAAGLIMDTAGNLYGTTGDGGTFNLGTVFKVDTLGRETILHSFAGPPNDGAYPFNAPLVMDAAGNLYGTTSAGGPANNGTIFKIDTSGNETVLIDFGGGPDAISPAAGLVIDAEGNLYGTAVPAVGSSNGGQVFEAVANFPNPGKYLLVALHLFSGPPDGANPNAGLMMDSSGNLYGTTAAGGLSNQGTVFVLYSGYYGGFFYRQVYSFPGSPGGASPDSVLTMDAAGNLYGTTQLGGVSDGGTVFKLVPCVMGDALDYCDTVLHSFSGPPDGDWPSGGLIPDGAGNLYGTTFRGGPSDLGTVFKVDASGAESTFYAFTQGSPHYGGPYFAGLIMDQAGNLYGTTRAGGVLGLGTVFKLSLAPRFTGTITKESLAGDTLTATLVLTNTGVDQATSTSIELITLRTLSGTGTVVLDAPNPPTLIGNIAGGASADVPMTFTVPNGAKKFSVTESVTAVDPSGDSLRYSIGQIVLP